MSEERKPRTLSYARSRDLPLILQFALGAGWMIIIPSVYILALAAPFFTAVALYLVLSPAGHAYGIETTWQKVRFVACPATFTAIFTPLAVWLSVWIRRNANSRGV